MLNMPYLFRTFSSVVILILFAGAVWAADDVPPSEVELRASLLSILAGCDKNGHTIITREDEEIFKRADLDMALALLQPFEQDPSVCKRRYAYNKQDAMISRAITLGLKEGEVWRPSPQLQALRKRKLYAVCFDPDDGLARSLYGSLRRVDFSQEEKGWIRQHLATEDPRPRVISLAGIADLRDQIPRLKSLRMSDDRYAALVEEDGVIVGLSEYPGWMARVALARMGSREDLQFCVEKIESTQNMEVRLVVLLHYYAYIRQPETIALLQRYLESDSSLREGDESSRYSGFAYNILKKLLEDFPAGKGLERARAWMREQKSFRFTR